MAGGSQIMGLLISLPPPATRPLFAVTSRSLAFSSTRRAFSSSGAEKEEDGGEDAGRLQGRWASPRRVEPAVGTCLLPRAR